MTNNEQTPGGNTTTAGAVDRLQTRIRSLAALTPSPCPGDFGTVRPLKWNEPHSYPQWSAQFFGMRFEARIDTSRASCFGKFPLAINGLDAGQKFETVEAAKAYAQEQFETRIRDLMAAALTPSALSGDAGEGE